MEENTETTEELNERFANTLIPLTVTFGLFAITGVLGNLIVLVVFGIGREYRNNNFRIFVICLAVIDLLTSAFLIPAEMIKHKNYFSFENVAMCKIKCLFNVWAGTAAALSLLIISVDRYRKVCQPLKKQISPRLALRLCIILSFVVPLILSTPGAIMCGIREENKTNIYNNQTVVYLCATEPRFEKHLLRTLYKYTFMLLLVGVSGACMVMYVLIGIQIYKHWGSTPSSFRKDSGKELNSDYSTDTFGKISTGEKPLERSASNSTDVLNQTKVASTPPIYKKSNSDLSKNRPPLVKQGSAMDLDPKATKKLIKQISNASFSSALLKSRSDSMDSNSRRRTFSRQASGFGLRRFPYKTLIWFILTIIFVITYILYVVMSIKVPTLYKKDPQPFTVFQAFFRLYFINNIINPIIYALLDKRFRQSCKNIVPTIKRKLKS